MSGKIANGPRGRKPGRKTGNEKHRIPLLKQAMRELGKGAIDGRTTAGKALRDLKDRLIEELGRSESISTKQEALIDLAVRTKFMLDRIDAWLLTRPSLVNKRRGSVIPIVNERQQLAQALLRYLDALGQ